MDDAHTVLPQGDVLVVDDRIAAVGTALDVPEGRQEIDATGGIVMPGMIDTHRHMWQTAMRDYGADWTLTQYFVWYYLEHGKHFRPQDVHAGNTLSAWEGLEAGVTTTVDWSHGLQTVDHPEAAADALVAVPGRFVLANGNIQAGPWQWTADPAVQAFLERRRDAGQLGLQLAFDVTGDPAFPEKAAFEVARELGLPVTTHAGVWGATSDASMADVVLIRNECSPVSFPLLNPYGHVAFQAQRGDVHTVVVDSRVVKSGNRLVGADLSAVRQAVDQTVEHLQTTMGRETWEAGMNPALPEGGKVLDNPYTYTEFTFHQTHEARGSLFESD